MKNYIFQTDIHCKNCVTKLEKVLQNKKEVNHFEIDEKQKILRIEGEIIDIQDFEDKIFNETQVYIEYIK